MHKAQLVKKKTLRYTLREIMKKVNLRRIKDTDASDRESFQNLIRVPIRLGRNTKLVMNLMRFISPILLKSDIAMGFWGFGVLGFWDYSYMDIDIYEFGELGILGFR